MMCPEAHKPVTPARRWGLSPRGAGYLFGGDVCSQFNAANSIDLIARAHQLVMEARLITRSSAVAPFLACLFQWKSPRAPRDAAPALHTAQGFKLMFQDQLVTVWSAPNYCYRCGNVAAILELDESLNRNFKVFEAAPQEVRTGRQRCVLLA